MELVVESDIYTPSIGETGEYIDKIPPFTNIKNGLRCPCGARKAKCYESYSIFASHIKTKSHQKWLSALNANRANYYTENENNIEIIQQQKIFIAKLEKEISVKNMTIHYLTQQLMTQDKLETKTDNLIDFD
jgi:hypothetical protein